MFSTMNKGYASEFKVSELPGSGAQGVNGRAEGVMDRMATRTDSQTEFKRKATARRGQATRFRNEAKQDGSFTESARARTRAETNALMAASYEAGRVFDASLGAAATVRDVVMDAVRPLGEPRRTFSKVRDDAQRRFDRMERRGARLRSRAQRDVEGLGSRATRQAKERTPG
jgi:hypothetical protein